MIFWAHNNYYCYYSKGIMISLHRHKCRCHCTRCRRHQRAGDLEKWVEPLACLEKTSLHIARLRRRRRPDLIVSTACMETSETAEGFNHIHSIDQVTTICWKATRSVLLIYYILVKRIIRHKYIDFKLSNLLYYF